MVNLNKEAHIIVTGAAGFIGSCMVQYLNSNGYNNIILVDDFGVEAKRQNWENKQYIHIIERYNLFDWLQSYTEKIDFVFHLGARTDTTDFDYNVHRELNIDYSEKIWHYCTSGNIPLVYASSAATYGNGKYGYTDEHAQIEKLQPLNPYGISKNEFDKWVLRQTESPPFWIGLKFFNVYGPNEYHKSRMASVIWHCYQQIQKDGVVKLFKSHHPDYKDGQQLRDFVYVKDVIKIMYWLMDMHAKRNGASLYSGIYNLGTGKARSFLDLATATFKSLDMQPHIVFIDMPEDIRDKYQYFTEANMQKLHAAGYPYPFYTLEEGVEDYVKKYLAKDKLY